MSAVVVIPAYNRPEMLAVTLRRVSEANGADQNSYLFQFDAGFDRDNWEVVKKFPFPSFYGGLLGRVENGNSANILEGLQWGLRSAEETNAEIMHLLEEDVFIGRDYFDTHSAMHRQFKPWAVSLCRNQHQNYDPTQDAALIYKSRDYQSIGVSFCLDAVRKILVHNTVEYFEDMTGYLQRMFPNSRFGSLYPEQDGLIQRIIEKQGYEVLFSNVPRAFHAGFYSYHRAGRQLEGTLDEKIAQLEKMTEAEFNDRSTYKDIRVAPLIDYKVKEFYFE